MPSRACVAILAGGQSRRMGRDKRFIEYEGKTLLDRAVGLATRLVGERGHVWVCGRAPGYECLEDERAGVGPLAGVTVAVRRAIEIASMNLGAPPLLVMPVDMPLLTAEVCAPLLFQLQAFPGVRASRYAGNELPFVLRCDEGILGILLRRCASDGPERSLAAFQSEILTQEILLPLSVAATMENMNSISDLLRLKEVHHEPTS